MTDAKELPGVEVDGKRLRLLADVDELPITESSDGEVRPATSADLLALLGGLDDEALAHIVETISAERARRNLERCPYVLTPAGFPVPNPPRCTLKRFHDGEHRP